MECDLTYLENLAEQIYETVAINIGGTAQSDSACVDNLSTTKAITYEGKGLLGLHENLKIINQNLDYLRISASQSN